MEEIPLKIYIFASTSWYCYQENVRMVRANCWFVNFHGDVHFPVNNVIQTVFSSESLCTARCYLREISLPSYNHLWRLVIFSYRQPTLISFTTLPTLSAIFGRSSLILRPFDPSKFPMVLELNLWSTVPKSDLTETVLRLNWKFNV